jgi:hypothetical protein
MCNCRKKRRPILNPSQVTPPRPATNATTASAEPQSAPTEAQASQAR